MGPQPQTKVTITFTGGETIEILCYAYTMIMGCVQLALSPIRGTEGELEHPGKLKFFPMIHVQELSTELIKKTEIN